MRWKWIIGIAAAAIVLIGMYWPSVQTIQWTGSCDLEIEFQVADAITGRPVPNAIIRILCGGGFYRGAQEERDKQFDLRTDVNGSVRRVCPDSMCGGRSGGYRDTWGIHLPWWHYTVVAEGYRESDFTEVDVIENQKRVIRPSKGQPAKLTIAVALQPKS